MHVCFMCFFCIFPAFIDMGGLIAVFNQSFDVPLFIVGLILTILPFAGYGVARLLYPYTYVIEDTCLVKRKRSQNVFEIQIDDIKHIVVKKATFCNYCKFLVSLISYRNVSTAHLTTVSFVFEKCDFLDEKDYKSVEFKRERVYKNQADNVQEYVEIVPYRTAIKLCKLLKKEYSIL